jgi:hypothetical protein
MMYGLIYILRRISSPGFEVISRVRAAEVIESTLILGEGSTGPRWRA